MKQISTESRNEASMHLDEMTIIEALQTMNREDKKVPQEINKIIPQLADVIDVTINRFNNGGRIIYLGAGTSGRLGVLDAAECVPTFNTSLNEVIGLIAGGQRALTVAVEGAEDNPELAKEDLTHIHLSHKDVVIGIAASGATPYVQGGLKCANEVGAHTVAISCNRDTPISKLANQAIEVDVGPEILTGSTRLKAGTAQKLILNMISTITMVGVGKVYDNLMVDVKATNKKLIDRSIRIIQEICDISYSEAKICFEDSGENVKTAIVMQVCNLTRQDAEEKLNKNNSLLKRTIQQ
ncbi:N-acetylmuramic acid 6-phosphate etherase [Staphylococcus gallinarum]|uniref:N-acetylmuramic acid 6-phosphate etherase n=1 Tax=Staphylococcus gallinarum TaxID=1293 RepID=A0A3A0VWK1_STAGA|nr:N-acetylmuramic acid 6-phosphate etherase [Staphylococcus gallinarum]RIP37429.1 N-acetylmuramic acid 6-phosphate etherase [Staphylococcus gallinarum]